MEILVSYRLPERLHKILAISLNPQLRCPVESHRHTSCPAGHLLPRCSLTMRQCSIVPYMVCTICSEVALSDVVVDSEDNPRCIYCETSFVIDEKVRSVAVTTTKLSKCSTRLEQTDPILEGRPKEEITDTL
uniref:Transcription factor IIIC putative zinc-finger domain-containing protein n=1 Tax=Timema monikensis TaxID=170555 RepID=A0A7R9EC19_9NEOP|nr:unnamed protein product [Timema monikensis]